MIYEKTQGQVLLEPLLGKQNIQAKDVYNTTTAKSKDINIMWWKSGNLNKTKKKFRVRF